MQNQRWHISGASKRSARCELMRNAEQIKYEMKPNTSKEKWIIEKPHSRKKNRATVLWEQLTEESFHGITNSCSESPLQNCVLKLQRYLCKGLKEEGE